MLGGPAARHVRDGKKAGQGESGKGGSGRAVQVDPGLTALGFSYLGSNVMNRRQTLLSIMAAVVGRCRSTPG